LEIKRIGKLQPVYRRIAGHVLERQEVRTTDAARL